MKKVINEEVKEKISCYQDVRMSLPLTRPLRDFKAQSS
jgi:hypothetical protein